MTRSSLLVAAAFSAALAALSPSPAAAQVSPPFAAVGPVSTVHPFPLWYQNSTGSLQLEPCLDNVTTIPANPCQLVAGAGLDGNAFDPALPIVFPTNFPQIVRYYLANTEVPVTFVAGRTNNRGVVFTAELVATFTGGASTTPQVFTHIRIDTNEALQAGSTYTFTHPYGTFSLAADSKGDVCPANNKACDIYWPSNPAPVGVFTGVLVANGNPQPNNATMGTFLTDIVPPAGFIGDGAARLVVTGSPTGNNLVRIEGPGILDNACGGIASCSQNILFTKQGRKFSAAGGPANRFVVTGPATGVAGVTQTFTVTALDANGNTATTYAGTVHFTSSDANAVLPANATLTLGVGSFQAAPRTAGSVTFTATDTVRAALTGSTAMAVSGAAAATLVAVSGGGQTAGLGTVLPVPLTVKAADQFGNPTAASVTFTPPVGGAVGAQPVATDPATGLASTTATLANTAGTQVFTATTGALPPVTFSEQAGEPGVPISLAVTGLPAGVTAGASNGFTVTALDAFGVAATLATGPGAGSLTITSSDGAAVLPASPTLTLGTAGFAVTFKTAGPHTLTAALTATPAITDTVSTLVSAGAATTLVASSGGGQTGTVGAALAAPLVVKVTDAFNNPKAGVAVTFAAPATGSVGTPSALTAADGTASTTATLGSTAGAQSFTATSAGLTGSPLSFAATASPGAATTLAVTGLAPNVTAGVATGFTVTAKDTFGNTATGFAGSVSFTSSDPSPTLPAASGLTAGVGAFSATFRTAGARTLTATVVGQPAVTGAASTTVGPAAANTLASVSGGGQSGTVGAALAAPFVVSVTDQFGNAVPGVTVTFAAPAGGSVAPSSVATDAAGLASATGTLATTVVGAQSFSASSTGLAGSPLAFTATAAPGAATTLAVTGLAASTTAGVATPFTVTARDTFGNTATGFAATVSFTSTDGAAVLPAAGGLTSGVGTFSATFKTAGARTLTAAQAGAPAVTGSASTTVTPAAPSTISLTGAPASTAAGLPFQVTVVVQDAFGNAPASPGLVFSSSDPGAALPLAPVLTGDTGLFSVTLVGAGTRTLTVSPTGFAAVTATASVTVTAGAATALTVVSGNGQSGTVGALLAAPLIVRVTDAFNNPKAGVAVTFTAPATGSVGTPSAVTAADGTASSTATLGGTAGAQTFTATSAGLAGSPASFPATAAPGAASALAITGLPATTAAGASAPFTVTVRDGFGNVATGFAGQVAFTSTDPAAVLPAAGGLGSGVGAFAATFKTTGSRTLTATVVGAPSVTGSAGTTVTPAAPATLAVVSGGGQSGTVGAPLAAPFIVKVTDSLGNALPGFAVTFSAPAGASISPTSTTTDASGQASATATLATTTGTQSFTATAGSLAGSPLAFSATANPGAATALAITGLPAGTTAGTPTGFTVSARDTFGNVASGFAGTVHFTGTDALATLPADATLTAGTGAFSATFRTSGARSLTATQVGAPAVSGSAATTVAPAAPSTVLVTGAPATTPAGLVFQVTVTVRDAFGNAPANPGLVFSSSDPNAVLPVAPTLTGDTGLFDVTLVGAGTRSITVAPAGFPAVTGSTSLSVVAGTAATLAAVSGGGQSGTVGLALASPFVVKVTDTFGNPKSGVNVAFAGPGSLSPASAATAADGTASSTATLGGAVGAQAYTASSAGLSGSPVTFTATAAAGPAYSLAITGLPATTPAGASPSFTVTVRDAFANLATGFAGTVAFTSTDPAATLPPTSPLVAGTGAGTFTVTFKTTGPRSLTATVVGDPTVSGSASTTVGAAAPATLVAVSGGGQSGAVGAALAAPFIVKVTDSLGNAVPGFAVTFSAPAGASISPASTTTDASGQASATATLATTTGTQSFTATAGSLAGSPLAFSATATAGAATGLALARTASGTLDDCGCYDLAARLQDRFGNLVAQATTVTVAADGAATVQATDLATTGLPAATVTGPLKADGTAAVTVCASGAGAATVTLSSAGLASAAPLPLTWSLAPASAAASTLAADANPVTAFSGRSHLTVTPRSTCGHLLGAAQAVTINASGPGSITPVVDAGNGTYTATLTVTTCPATTTQVTARVGAVDLTPLEVGVTCLVPSEAQTLVQLDRAAVVLCDNAAKDAVHVTVTPRDAAGADMGPGHTVALVMAGVTAGAVSDAGNGTYTATLAPPGCLTGPHPLTVRVNGTDLLPAGAAVDFSCAAVDPAASGISVPPAHPLADNAATAALTVAAVNTCGDPARAKAVTVSSSLGTLAATAGTTDSAGTFATSLRSGTAGAATLQATVGGVALPSATVTFDAPPAPASSGGCGTGGGGGLLALLGAGLGLARLRRRQRR